MNIQPSNNFNYTNNVSFQKGKNKEASKLTKWLAKTYGQKMLNSDGVRKACKTMAGWDCGDVTRHLMTLGSFITSSAYMTSTLKNKDFDKKKANTLAVNQGLCFIVPTIAAYTVDACIRETNKQVEYKYSAVQERKLANMKMTEKEMAEAVEKLGKRLKGFRTLVGIITFATMYRYVTPVAITPIANWIGKKINAKTEAEAEEQKAKEISINANKPESGVAKKVKMEQPKQFRMTA